MGVCGGSLRPKLIQVVPRSRVGGDGGEGMGEGVVQATHKTSPRILTRNALDEEQRLCRDTGKNARVYGTDACACACHEAIARLHAPTSMGCQYCTTTTHPQACSTALQQLIKIEPSPHLEVADALMVIKREVVVVLAHPRDIGPEEVPAVRTWLGLAPAWPAFQYLLGVRRPRCEWKHVWAGKFAAR